MTADEILLRNNIHIFGEGSHTLLMAHGFGCDQNMWRYISHYFESDYRIVLFDYVGSGQSQLSAYQPERYSSLQGYAQDIIEICETLDLENVILIGHSVSCMTAMYASQQINDRVAGIVMIAPSPCFMNEPPEYHGGFEPADLEDLLRLMDKNMIGWADYLAPLVIGQPDQALVGELADSFCSTDPFVAKNFARAAFFTDCRDDLMFNTHPTLIVQSRTDNLAPIEVGHYMQSSMPDSELVIIPTEGHCPHMTDPRTIKDAITPFLMRLIA